MQVSPTFCYLTLLRTNDIFITLLRFNPSGRSWGVQLEIQIKRSEQSEEFFEV